MVMVTKEELNILGMNSMESYLVDSIELDENSKLIVINKVTISNPTLYNFLIAMGKDERKQFVERILSIGFNVSQTMNQTSRVDYVKSEFGLMTEIFIRQFKEVFSDDGKISGLLESYFGEKGDVTNLISDHFGKDGKIVSEIFNPSDKETPLGKFVEDLEKLLDITQEDSAFYKLKQCVETEFTDLKTKMEVRDRVAEAIAKEREKGTVKGKIFQLALYDLVDIMAKPFEDTVSFVGDETGLIDKIGDILIQINPSNTKGIDKKIIIEAKNAEITMRGRSSFLTELEDAMENYVAEYAIGAVHESHTPQAIGEFRRYSGNRIIVKIPEESYPFSLEIAYKVARTEIIAKTLADEIEIDATTILEKVDAIKAKLDLMQATKLALTTSKSNIDTAYGYLETIEAEIKDVLDELTTILETEENTE